MEDRTSGFREIAHTADWELEAWASDLGGLLEQAARGMYALAGAQLQAAPRIARQLSLAAPDPESLLVSFLSELLYLGEQEGIGFDRFSLQVDSEVLQADLEGAPLQELSKEIKAVTYHRLAIRSEAGVLRVRIVFDV